jgi:hypothetical protein
MPVQLILDDDGSIAIPLDDCTQEAWVLQQERAFQAGAINGFRERLAQCFAMSLIECLDADLKPPTEAQVKYATAIARDLGIPLPPEVLRFRGPMADFIGRFADVMRQKRQHNLERDNS